MQTEPFDSDRTTIFFENLLPPDQVRRKLGPVLHLSRHNIFGFLEALGGDCAGAISLWPPNVAPHEADELAYVFAPNEEHDKIGLVARYGEWCCEAYVPCDCVGVRTKCYWDSLQTNRSETVYFESEKAKWLEKVRPLVESL